MKSIIGAAIGDCVHVGGLDHFLHMAESEGYSTKSLGPAVSLNRIIKVATVEKPTMLALSYRLTPEVASRLFAELKAKLPEKNELHTQLIFGGSPPVAVLAKESGLFERVFDGSETAEEIRYFLKNMIYKPGHASYAEDLLTRIKDKYPYPLLRHHFGRPSLQETMYGICKIARAEVLDIISIGTDQNAQEFFFRQTEMDHNRDGAGGVPVRTFYDLEALYISSRYGNFPLMRCYAGTQDLTKWAEMSVKTINNAWGAIPLCWYSVIDGRSKRSIRDAISENQSVMRWYAEQNIPVEVNEAHQWSLRDAHDTLAVAMAYIAAYNAKKAGVSHYISQLMFNTPAGTWPVMDLAKMLAKQELIQTLEDSTFSVYREVRAGIAHFASEPFIAKGQLAASALISLHLKPHILHVVGFSEGDHAITPDELIESCKIVHGVIRNGLHGLPEVLSDEQLVKRKVLLKKEAEILLDAIRSLGPRSKDPLADPSVLALAIEKGILDAPAFRGNEFVRGEVQTRMINGACYAIDPTTGEPLTEEERLQRTLKKVNY